ncbi:hypothetical protein Skr01_67920 [Sphaerisporangium krabiense]|uniref:Uncharacterized protein n=1 Tax=Sphaerisporangium krabiense TaxID=763782 RepID=A0A7W8Z3Q3_9ACTN|nr:hypothetical protein [Sphaerisporangium krabiense]MBB5626907.1 hypothetical protein [Sphaerisporangium krabiense]GII66707.1 hypothetical protein Skr01_67920 [Sphaerisporangium krabiense]
MNQRKILLKIAAFVAGTAMIWMVYLTQKAPERPVTSGTVPAVQVAQPNA